MKQFDPKQLGFFTGTTAYHLHAPRVVLTDGAKYVAEHAQAYWLMDAIASYLPVLVNREHFVVASLAVKNQSALLWLTDGNYKDIASQRIPYTDFPMPDITLFACWSDDCWVLMLPSEY
jgi:hypothetical protein